MNMDAVKPYAMAIVIQLVYTGLFVVSKVAFDDGMSTYVFIFYHVTAAPLLLLPIAILLERRIARSMPFTLLVKLFLYALIGITFTLNMSNVSIKFTSATVASATSSSAPLVTFFMALLLSSHLAELCPSKMQVLIVARL